jgi:hypothetical protein
MSWECVGGVCSPTTERSVLTNAYHLSIRASSVYHADDPPPPGLKVFDSRLVQVVQPDQIAAACQLLSNESVLGLDCEWNVNMVPGGQAGIVATLQLATSNQTLIFHLYHLHVSRKLPNALCKLLGDERITFVGRNIKGDCDYMKRDYGICVLNTADVGHAFNLKYPAESKNWGLQVRARFWCQSDDVNV